MKEIVASGEHRADSAMRHRPSVPGARRAILAGAVVALGLLWMVLPRLVDQIGAGGFEFVALEYAPGFRRIEAGQVSSGLDPLAGLVGRADTGQEEAPASVSSDPCHVLFGPDPIDPGTVPIAFFTDYNCPYCRVMSQQLTEFEQDLGESVRIAWHEWPVLGDASERAARAALAARRQRAYRAFHQRLIRSRFLPTPAYLQDISGRVGIDAERLLRDMQSPEIERELARTRALAAFFRFPGTPGLIVGRTVVQGAIEEPRLRALIERERSERQSDACTGIGRHDRKISSPAAPG
jgi:protein-disulfide isomerase